MRILHITPTYAPVKGGTETLVQRVSETLASWGHNVTVLTSDFRAVSGFYRLGVERISSGTTEYNSVTVDRLSYGRGWYSSASAVIPRVPSRRLRSVLEFHAMTMCWRKYRAVVQRRIDSLKPDVVLATPHLLPNVRAAVLAHKTGNFPLVLVPCLHEEDEHWPVDEMTEVLREADGIIAMTPYEASRLMSLYAVEKAKITVGGFGVDMPNSEEMPVVQRSPAVLFLGRKVPGKGIPLLLETMQLVWKQAPHMNLILAGAWSPETLHVNELVHRLPPRLQANVTSLDDVTHEVKARLLRTSLCLVLPSKFESFGGVILEAWAEKTAVITMDLPVFRSYVVHGRDGLLVPPDDAMELASAILQLERDRTRALELGQAGYQKAKTLFSWDRIALHYLEAYSRVL